MILTGRTPRLRANNYLQALTAEIDDTTNVETMAEQFMQKVTLIAGIHRLSYLMWNRPRRNRKGPMQPAKGSRCLKD